MIPALAHEASCPGFCRSKTQTRSPARANSNAIAPPITPPPAIATSHFFLLAVLVPTTFTPFVPEGVPGAILAHSSFDEHLFRAGTQPGSKIDTWTRGPLPIH